MTLTLTHTLHCALQCTCTSLRHNMAQLRAKAKHGTWHLHGTTWHFHVSMCECVKMEEEDLHFTRATYIFLCFAYQMYMYIGMVCIECKVILTIRKWCNLLQLTVWSRCSSKNKPFPKFLRFVYKVFTCKMPIK